MVIITNGVTAIMFYSESQWLDASDEAFPSEDWGFRVPNSTPNSEILGEPPVYNSDGTITPATPPMTQAAVAAIATEVLFEPAPVKD